MTDDAFLTPSAAPAHGADPADPIDTTVPNSARIWNYWLGGRDHYEADRLAGDRYRTACPSVVDVARASRSFHGRTVAFLARDVGLTQFLDIGTGLPGEENTHEIVQRWQPRARVVYVDNDPLVLAHARALLVGGTAGVTDYVHGDLHDPDGILAAAARTLDFTEPVGLVLSGVLGHARSYETARWVVHRLLDGVPPGSHLTANDGTSVVRGEFAEAQSGYNSTGAVPYHLRTPEQIAGFFDGLKLVEPGVVSCPLWRPDPGAPDGLAEVDAFGGVGRKP